MIKLYNDDFFNIVDQIEDNSIDLILTDPPYGINYNNFDWDNIDFNSFTEKWLSECKRILKKNGSMWSFINYENVINFIQLQEKYFNVKLENWVIWCRSKGRNSEKHLKSTREDIIHSVVSKNNFTWNNLKVLREVIAPYMKDGKPRGWFVDETGKRVRWTGLGNVWCYTSPFHKFKDDLYLDHPHQKPILMIERLLKLSSNENDLIFDPFMGTGTVGFVCKNNNRNFIGIEKDKKYFNIAEKRINGGN